ncbi:MAG: metal ABC transporter permease [Sulfolobales archaeon]
MLVLDTIALGGLIAVILGGLTFSSIGYVLTISQTLILAHELLHSLLAASLLGALIESITGFIPMQLTIFLYSMAMSVLVAELVKLKIPRDVVVAIVPSVSAIIAVGSLWGLVRISPLGVSKALGVLWGSVLLITPTDLVYLAAVAVTVMSIIYLFDLELKYISFDPDLAYVSGLNVRAYYYLVYASTSLSLSATIKVFGTVIATALIVLPSVFSLRVARRVNLKIFLALGLLISVPGYLMSILLNIQTSFSIGIISLTVTLIGGALRWSLGR